MNRCFDDMIRPIAFCAGPAPGVVTGSGKDCALAVDHRWEDTICRAVCHDHTMSIEDGQSFFRDLKWAE